MVRLKTHVGISYGFAGGLQVAPKPLQCLVPAFGPLIPTNFK